MTKNRPEVRRNTEVTRELEGTMTDLDNVPSLITAAGCGDLQMVSCGLNKAKQKRNLVLTLDFTNYPGSSFTRSLMGGLRLACLRMILIAGFQPGGCGMVGKEGKGGQL